MSRSELSADICVIGAGIIGLYNTIQYAKRGFTVVLVDELTPRSKNNYKVGESLFGASNAFLRTVCDLDEAIGDSFVKRGVWFTYGMEGKSAFDNDIAEFGFQGDLPQRWRDRITAKKFGRAMFEDAQIVRPEVEAKMRAHLVDFPQISFLDCGLVRDIQLGDDTRNHEITWRSRDSTCAGTIHSRWLVDCSGRARLLVKKMNHDVPLDDGFDTSAVWAQFSCTFDESDDRWNFDFPDGGKIRRDLDTVHLWGDGYWIWIIRLVGDRISVGVSFDRKRAEFAGNMRDIFWEVIKRYPVLDFLTEDRMLDFGAYRKVQHITDTYVSARRYAIAGDAASIIDAYYSQGMSLAMVHSWHAANIAERDLCDNVLDTDYIDHVNRTALADWLIIRGMVKYKYGPAMSDSRFFILDHLLDYLIFGAFLADRFRVASWLHDTGGYTEVESPQGRKLRMQLSRSFSLSQSAPWRRFDPLVVAKTFDRYRNGLSRRAQWRSAHGVHLRPATGIMRPDAPVPAVWRLPFLNLMRRPNVTPPAFVEPAFMSPDISAKLPHILARFGTFLLPIVWYAVAYDIVDTTLRRARRVLSGIRPHGVNISKSKIRKNIDD